MYIEKKTMVKRILMSLFGVLTGAVSVAVFKIAAFGVDPFQTFMAGPLIEFFNEKCVRPFLYGKVRTDE